MRDEGLRTTQRECVRKEMGGGGTRVNKEMETSAISEQALVCCI